VDPLRVVIARETLRECWEATTAYQREAIQEYLARQGDGVITPQTIYSVYRARVRARPILAA
jgi:hypothetical protein